MTSTTKECKYCFVPYSSSVYPMLLPCRCIVCNHCLNYFKIHPNPNIGQCYLCKKLIILSNSRKYEALLSAIQEQNFIEQGLIEQYNEELKAKMKYCSNFISHSGNMLENLKQVEIYYIYIKYFKSTSINFNGIDDRLAYVKKFSLLCNQRFDVVVSKRIVFLYLKKLFRNVYEILLLYEIFQVSEPWMTIWMGNQIIRYVNDKKKENESVYIRNDSKFDVVVNALGFFLGVTGNADASQRMIGKISVYEIILGEREEIYCEELEWVVDTGLRFTCEAQVTGIVMKGGVKYYLEWETQFRNQISMFYEEVLQLGEIRLEISAVDRKGTLAFLKCEPLVEGDN